MPATAQGKYVAQFSGTTSLPSLTTGVCGKSGSGAFACKVSATMVWTPDASKPSEPPPKTAIVRVSGKASFGVGGPPGSGAGGSCTDGTIPCSISSAPNGTGASGSLPATVRYSVKSDPGPSFPISEKPEARMTGSPVSGGVSAELDVSATPVTIGLAGTTLHNSALKVLTGQLVKGTLSAGYTVVPGSHSWQAEGGAPFRNFTATDGNGYKEDLDQNDFTKPIFNFFTAEAGNVKVTCTATVQLPDGNKSVSAEARPLTSVKPQMNWQVLSFNTRFNIDPETGPTHALFFSPFYLGVSGNLDGQRSVITTTIESPFSGGQGSFSQLVTPGRYTTLQNYFQEVAIPNNYSDGSPGNGTEAHDGSFPNASWSLPGTGQSHLTVYLCLPCYQSKQVVIIPTCLKSLYPFTGFACLVSRDQR